MLLTPEETAHDGNSKTERYQWSDPSSRGQMRWVQKSELYIDRRYQRDANETKILALASHFNWPAFGVLIVAERGNGKLFVAEGQHRLLASLKRADVQKVPCIIFKSDGLAGEAQTFIDTNTNRRPVSAIQKLAASITAGDPVAIKVGELIKAVGRTPGRNEQNGKTVACVALLRRLIINSESTTVRLWPFIAKELCRDTQIHERILDSLVYIEDRLHGGASLLDERWRTRIMRDGVGALLQSSASAASMYARGGARVWSEGIVARINRGLSENNQLCINVHKSVSHTDTIATITKVSESAMLYHTVSTVIAALKDNGAMAISDIMNRTKLSKGQVERSLRKLKLTNKVFMGGERRFARYALSKADAEAASKVARFGEE